MMMIDDDDDDDAIMVTPKRRRSQGGMAEILKDAMKAKRQANEIRQKELELKAEELKQNHICSSKTSCRNSNSFSNNSTQ